MAGGGQWRLSKLLSQKSLLSLRRFKSLFKLVNLNAQVDFMELIDLLVKD